ncbi:MAG: hypothetical protein ACHQRL_01630 [Gemmatimonadales bacterium]
MSATDGDWIDPVDFPFTEEEVVEAVRLWHATPEQFTIARAVIAQRRRSADRRAEYQSRADAAAKAGVVFVHGELSDDASREPWFFPALSVLSEYCAARVDDAMQKHWRQRLDSELTQECVASARRAGLFPTRDQFNAVAQDPERRRELMADLRRKMPILPEPTEEIRRAVSARIEREKQEWLALAAEAKIRLAGRRAAIGWQPPARRRS